jgi:hypothetical protein
MGKERYWVGKSSKKSVIVEENETKTTPTPPSGCMCAVFQFFDFHPFHFPNTINHQQEITSSCISKDHTTTTTTTVPKGILICFNFFIFLQIFFWNMFNYFFFLLSLSFSMFCYNFVVQFQVLKLLGIAWNLKME